LGIIHVLRPAGASVHRMYFIGAGVIMLVAILVVVAYFQQKKRRR
jgi:hypothetical protein